MNDSHACGLEHEISSLMENLSETGSSKELELHVGGGAYFNLKRREKIDSHCSTPSILGVHIACIELEELHATR